MRIMKINIIAVIALFSCIAVSCTDDILDQPPKDGVELDEFFNTENDLKTATNDLYAILPGIDAYTDDANSDNIVQRSFGTRIRGTRLTPTDKGSGGWSWSQLRRINFVLENYHRVDDAPAREKYSGIARFFRAYFYFEKVKRFGDVPWYNKVLDVEDEDELYKARDSREMVMDSVLADINYAVENIPAEKKLDEVTQYTALLLKARLGLHEGTFRKYHGIDGGDKFLEEAADAAEELISSGAYMLNTEGGPDEAYGSLFNMEDQNDVETILAAKFTASDRRHDFSYRLTAPTQGTYGLPKDLVNSYLMRDGSRFTDADDYSTMEFYEEMQNRDPRLTQTTAGPDFSVPGEDKREPVDMSISTTGYRYIKGLQSRDKWGSGASTNDVILFRYAEALLILAEAKAELGTLTQEDLDKSINVLRDRVSMPHLSMSEANSNPDSYQEELYYNIDQGANKGVLLEIRRERRIELVGEGFRWDDLMRWKEGKKIEQPMVGIYFPNLGAYDFNNDGVPDVYVYDGDASGAPKEVSSKNRINIKERPLYDPNTGQTGGTSGNLDPFTDRGRFNEDKDYYYPIPLQDLLLNENLEQNPGWEK